MKLPALALACTFTALGAVTPALADDKSAFIVDMTHAYYAAYELCPNTKIVPDGIFAAGEKVGFDEKDVIDIDNAIRRLNGNEKVDRPSANAAKTVAFAATTITAELNRRPKEAWCDFRVPILIEEGMLARGSS